jgi:hypothetical protein
MIPGESRKVVEPERLKGKGWKKGDKKASTYFGDNYYVDYSGKGRAIFKLNYLNEGEYRVYNYKSNRWVEMDSVVQRREGRFVYRVNSSTLGGEVDAILLVREEN